MVLTTPTLRRPLYAGVGRAFRWYRGLPEPLPILATLGAAAAFYLIPWTPLALLFLALWAVLAFLRIDLGLATVALALPLYTRPKVLFGRPISVVELSLALCLAAWAAARLLDWGRRLERRTGWRTRSTCCLMRVQQWLAQAPRLARAPAQALRWRWTRAWSPWSLVALASVEGWAPRAAALREWRTLFFESALFYALIRLAVRSPRAQRRVAEGWLLGAAGIAAVGLGQWLLGRNLISAEGTWRVRGFFGSPNNLALYLGRALPGAAGRGLAGAARRPGRQGCGAGSMALVALGVLGALLLTRSRGALLLAPAGGAAGPGPLAARRRALWVSLGALVVLALLAAGAGPGRASAGPAARPDAGHRLFPAQALALDPGDDRRPPPARRGAGWVPVCLSQPLRAALGLGRAEPLAPAQPAAGRLDAAGAAGGGRGGLAALLVLPRRLARSSGRRWATAARCCWARWRRWWRWWGTGWWTRRCIRWI